MSTVSLEELQARVGEEFVGSEWTTVDQAMIDKFADATGDHQFIHVDPDRAALTPFGGTIAHGFLTLSLMPLLNGKVDLPRLDGIRMGVNYGGNKVRFLAPVRSGKRVRGRNRLIAVEEKRPGQIQITSEFAVEIEGEDKPAMIAEWISQVFI
ncbi:MAG: MaoC family dehydratase [Sphingomonadaceae bacterium]|nr:MaoC family dehydratase [Sphingomonadaceae bacterium]